MTKPVKIIMIIIILIFIFCCIWAIFIFQKPQQQNIKIIQDNQILQEIDLAIAEDQEINIPTSDGGYNIIKIQNHEIFISQADCPDQTCVKSGILKAQGLPIVCLPHKLIIRFAAVD
ncbi:MAG: NusG domain II-containing protein [Oscillospiraceae bacterium]|nr:NusG domain II-containing protein [Oscillospiraceae bacterium]